MIIYCVRYKYHTFYFFKDSSMYVISTRSSAPGNVRHMRSVEYDVGLRVYISVRRKADPFFKVHPISKPVHIAILKRCHDRFGCFQHGFGGIPSSGFFCASDWSPFSGSSTSGSCTMSRVLLQAASSNIIPTKNINPILFKVFTD